MLLLEDRDSLAAALLELLHGHGLLAVVQFLREAYSSRHYRCLDKASVIEIIV